MISTRPDHCSQLQNLWTRDGPGVNRSSDRAAKISGASHHVVPPTHLTLNGERHLWWGHSRAATAPAVRMFICFSIIGSEDKTKEVLAVKLIEVLQGHDMT